MAYVNGKRNIDNYSGPPKTTKGTANGPINTYYLSEEELSHYRALPHPKKEEYFGGTRRKKSE